MSTNSVTIIATLKDYFTGPAKRAEKAVEDLGKAAQESGKRAEAAADKAAKATEGQAKKTESSGRRMEQAFQRIDGRAGRMATALEKASGNGATAIERHMGRAGRALGRLDTAGAASKFGSGMKSMVRHANDAADKIGSAMGKVSGKIGLAAGALTGFTLYGGGTRLTDLETAEVKLTVMGYDQPTRESIMGTVNEAVLGTPFGLGEGAKVGTQLLGAGVGTDLLADRLGTVVDVASLYGNGDISDISTVLSQIQAKGRLMGEEALQLNERGMPVYDWIAQAKGVDKSEVAALISAGEVTADVFWEAVAPRVAKGSDMMGETFKGAWANLRTAFSRAGSEFLGPLMEPAEDLMRGVTDAMKGGKPFFTSLGQSLAPAITAAADKLPALLAALEPLERPLLNLFETVGEAMPELITGFTIWAGILARVLGPLTDVAAFLVDYLEPALPVLVPLVLGLGAGLSTWFVLRKLNPLLKGAWKLLGFIGKLLMNHPLLRLAVLLYTGIKAFGWLYENVELVRDVVDTLVGLFDDLDQKIRNIGNSIEELVRDKFPQLNNAMDTMKTGVANMDGGSAQSAIDGTRFGGNPIFTWIQDKTGLGGWLDDAMPWRKGADGGSVPAHAAGGWTGSGAHLATVGEEGREFVVNHWASEKINRAHPGALGEINRGRLPAVPVGGGAPVVINQNITVGAGADREKAREFAAEWRAQMARFQRENRLTNFTLTARGAR